MNNDRPAGRSGPAFDESALLAELAQLATATLPEFVFLQELLKRALMGLRGEAGAIWMCDAERRLVLQQEVCLDTTGFLNDAGMQAACERQFAEVFRTGGVISQQLEQEVPGGQKRRRSLLLAALARNSQIAGLVQVFEAPWAGDDDRPQRMQFLGQLCGIASRFWLNNPNLAPQPAPPMNAALLATALGPDGSVSPQLAPQGAAAPRVQPLAPSTAPPGAPTTQPTPTAVPQATAKSSEDDQWVLSLYGHQKSVETALVAANECRRLIAADRVTVGEQFGPRVKIQAVSGQQAVSARSNAVRLLTKLAEQVCATGEKLKFTGDTQKFPSQVEALLADYLLDSRSRVIIVQPVFGPKPRHSETSDRPEIEAHSDKNPRPVGVLVVEQISETPLPADVDDRLDRIAAHVGLALENAQNCERIFLLPLWKLVGNWKSRLRGRKLWKFGAAFAALAVVALILIFVPSDYRVTGKGRMMPIERRGVFAPWDGEVIELPARSGQSVHAGDLLVRLRNEELESNLHTKAAALQAKEKEYFAVSSQLSDPGTSLNRANEIELHGKKAQLQAEIDGTKLQVASLTAQVEALSVRAPINGKIATFRIEELLRKRPVKYGELLLEVMDDTRTWRLEVDVPENRIGHILEAQSQSGSEGLRVKYMLATDTEADFYGTLETLSNRSVSSESEGVVVPVYVALVDPAPRAPTIGAEVTAKIYCGKRSLAYVWFGDVIEAARKYLWL
ncbi:MAG: HlyD family efflux transporter periplasmic adaptor subunit [Planctomycetia bacterium]|nr:HlyD family efflux transporter periplasmic adaptor subunit [Planctomycetia bacterium]